MRAKPSLILASLASAGALAFGVSSAGAAGGGVCSYPNLTNNNMLTTGTMSGGVKCSPGGKGKASFSYSSTIAPSKNMMSLNLVYSGKFKDKLKKGTINGTFKISGAILPPQGMTFTMSGKFTIKGGTGKLHNAHGSGKMTCSSSDLTMHFTCSQILTKGKI